MNIFSDNEHKKEQLEAVEFVRQSLQQLHKGDPRQIDDSLNWFMKDEAVLQLLGDLEALKGKLHARWRELGYGQGEATAAEAVDSEPDLYDEEPVVVEFEHSLEEAGSEEDLEEKSTLESHEGEVDAEDEEVGEVYENDASGEEEAPEVELELEINDEIKEEDREMDAEEVSEKTINVAQRRNLSLPNGKVGTKYQYDISLEEFRIDPERLLHVETKGFTESGLSFDQAQWRISGMPAQQGEVELLLELSYTAGAGKTGILILEGSCYINPDPRSLWQELEPDADAPYWKAHLDADYLRFPGMGLLAASRRGRAHAHKGGFRDDDYFIGQGPEGWLTLAVADGAGSAKFSREGSRIACHQAGKQLESHLSADFTQGIASLLPAFEAGDPAAADSLKLLVNDVVVGAIFEAYKSIVAEAEAQEVELRHYATTLLFTVLRPFGDKWFVASYWVGDGAIAAYKEGEWVKVLGQGDSGEFAGMTRFLTMPEMWQNQEAMLSRLHIDLLDDLTALVLMTDGISDPKLQTDYNLQQVSKWDELWADIGNEVALSPDNDEAPAQMLEWLNFWSQGDHDDRTIALFLPTDSKS